MSTISGNDAVGKNNFGKIRIAIAQPGGKKIDYATNFLNNSTKKERHM